MSISRKIAFGLLGMSACVFTVAKILESHIFHIAIAGWFVFVASILCFLYSISKEV